MSTSVKHIHSGMRGAPTINGTAGTLIAVLDALFTTGWGVTTAVSVSVASGIATATLTSGETFDRDAVVLVAGATPGELNGEARVLSSSSTSITWATEAADGAATGTITIRYAPQTSWQKVYAGTNKAAYRSNDVQSNGHFLRVDDTGTTTARVRGYEAMTNVDTGTGPFPTDAQMSGGGYWFKSTVASATAARYRIFCDERFIIFASAPNVANTTAPARGFGDPFSVAPGGDAWSTILSAQAGTNTSFAANGSLESNVAGVVGSGSIFSPRSFSGLGTSVLQNGSSYSGASISGADNAFGAAPSIIDGKLRPVRMFTRDQGTTNPLRSEVPGIYYLPQSGLVGLLNDGDTLDGAGELLGHRFLASSTGGNYSTGPNGVYLVDLTGPWR